MKINSSKPSVLFFRGLALLVIYCIPPAAYAQKVSMEVAEIMDNRVISQDAEKVGGLIVLVEVLGLQAAYPYPVLKPGKITRAVDDLGNTIQMDESTHDEYNEYTILNFRLNSPDRNASEISVLEGTVKYFNPTAANKGLLTFDKPVDKLGTNILKGKYSDIVIVPLDRKKLQKLKNENEKAYKQQLDILKKEYGPHAESIDELNQVLDDTDFGSDNELFFFYSDPELKVMGLSIVDAEGQSPTQESNATGNHVSYHLGDAPLSNSMKLVLTIENSQSVKEYPFKLEKIKLP